MAGKAVEPRFFGAWGTAATLARLKALAMLHGVSQSQVLRDLVDSAANRALAASEEPPGETLPAAEDANRGADGLEAQRAAVL